MTGRAAGYCAGFPVPGYMNPGPGRGFWGWGRGRGGGRGWRNWFHATAPPGWQQAGMGWPALGGGWGYGYPPAQGSPPPQTAAATKDQELDFLKGQAEYFQDALDGIRKRIDQLQTETEDK